MFQVIDVILDRVGHIEDFKPLMSRGNLEWLKLGFHNISSHRRLINYVHVLDTEKDIITVYSRQGWDKECEKARLLHEGLTAIELFSKVFGDRVNMVTPQQVAIVTVKKGRVAAEIAEGEGMRHNRLFAVTTAIMTDDCEFITNHELNRCGFASKSAAMDYIRELKDIPLGQLATLI